MTRILSRGRHAEREPDAEPNRKLQRQKSVPNNDTRRSAWLDPAETARRLQVSGMPDAEYRPRLDLLPNHVRNPSLFVAPTLDATKNPVPFTRLLVRPFP